MTEYIPTLSDDVGGDDLIATKLLKISQISYSSNDADLGFRPTFGPAYVPLYGSLREFTDFSSKYEDLNKGDVSTNYCTSLGFLFL